MCVRLRACVRACVRACASQAWLNVLSQSSETRVCSKAVDGQIRLNDNDVVEIGTRKFLFHVTNQPATPPTASQHHEARHDPAGPPAEKKNKRTTYSRGPEKAPSRASRLAHSAAGEGGGGGSCPLSRSAAVHDDCTAVQSSCSDRENISPNRENRSPDTPVREVSKKVARAPEGVTCALWGGCHGSSLGRV